MMQLWFAWKYLPLWYQQQLDILALRYRIWLWFAWKYLPLWYQQQRGEPLAKVFISCDLLENIYLCGINNNTCISFILNNLLWFAWKYLPLWYQQQHIAGSSAISRCCDLLENIYLCGINNNSKFPEPLAFIVVICLKISTFVVSTTTVKYFQQQDRQLWFAWKYLPLWYQQQLKVLTCISISRCDLLENIYLCGINNNST